MTRNATIAAIATATAVAVVLAALAALWIIQRDRTLPGTSVAGVEVGRMEADEVREALAPTVERRSTDPVTFTFRDRTFEVAPDEVGYEVDLDASTQAALDRGRQGLPGDVAERVSSLWQDRDLELIERPDRDATRAWVDDLADGLDRDRATGSVEADPETLEVDVELPAGSIEVRRDETEDALLAALASVGPDELEVPAETTPQQVPDAEVEQAGEQLRRAIAQPLTLSASGRELTVEPGDLARLARVRTVGEGEDTELELQVSEERVEDVLGDAAGSRFDQEPVEAGYSTRRTPPRRFDTMGTASFSPTPASVAVQEGASGARFAPGRAAEQLTELLRDGTRSAQLRVEVLEPELTTQRAEQLRPTHLIGTFTTFHEPGQPRVENIQQLADVVDGDVVLPDERFSINELSGRRRCEKGYEPAPTIIDGELEDTCGGGVSQFGTTTFNAAFFAGLQLDEYRAHSYYISRYPQGREATLSFPVLDVAFTNTTPGALLVKTSYSNNSITVSIYGQPLADEVTAIHGEPTNDTEHTTERRTDPDLPPGAQSVVQGGIDGFTVNVQREITRRSGGTDSQTLTTVYQPQTRIIETGSG